MTTTSESGLFLSSPIFFSLLWIYSRALHSASLWHRTVSSTGIVIVTLFKSQVAPSVRRRENIRRKEEGSNDARSHPKKKGQKWRDNTASLPAVIFSCPQSLSLSLFLDVVERVYHERMCVSAGAAFPLCSLAKEGERRLLPPVGLVKRGEG